MKKQLINICTFASLAFCMMLASCIQEGDITKESKTESTTVSTTVTTTVTTTVKEKCLHENLIDLKIITEADCIKEGTAEGRCEKCGENVRRTLPKAEHKVKVLDEKAASCIEEGLTKGSYCELCGEVLEEQKATGKTLHVFENGFCRDCQCEKFSQGLEYMQSGDILYVMGLGSCTEKEIIIPETYEGVKVEGIAGYAFKDSDITSLVMPDCVKIIGECAFQNCVKLESVKLSPLVKTLNMTTFDECVSLENLDISEVTRFSFGALAGCSFGELTFNENATFDSAALGNITADRVILPEGMQTVPSMLLLSAKVGEIILPEGITVIQSMAFADSSITSIKLPKSLKTLSGNVFENCTQLMSVDFSSAEFSLTGGANFKDCSKLQELKNAEKLKSYNVSDFMGTGMIKTHDGVITLLDTVIGFDKNFSGKELVIPKGITTIAKGAFESFENVERLIISEGVTKIESLAFNLCGFEYVYLPDSLVDIAHDAFVNCYKLKTLSVGKSITADKGQSVLKITPWTVEYRGKYSEYEALEDYLTVSAFPGATLVCSDKTVYQVVEEGKINFNDNFTYKLTSDGVLTISGEGAVPYTTLPATVKSRTVKLIISEGITRFEEGFYGGSAVSGLSSLVEVVLPKSIECIGDALDNSPWYASLNDTENIIITNNVLVLAAGIKGEYKVPDGITKIEKRAFAKNEKLTKVIISGSVKTIGKGAFYGCSALEEIIIPEGVEAIENNAFADCNSLRSLTFPTTLKIYSKIAPITSCDSLESVVFKSTANLTELPTIADCKSLKYVIYGEGGTLEAPINSLYECPSLESVVFLCKLSKVDHSAFWTLKDITKYYCLDSGTYELLKANSVGERAYLYSEIQPENEGNYWHYSKDGEIIIY